MTLGEPMTPLTESEMALVAYFYTIATDPRVKAAGYNPIKFGRAVLSRAEDDLVAVTHFVLKTGVEPKVTQATRNVAETMLGGTVSEKARQELVAGVETLVKDGFRWLGRVVDKDRKKR